MITCIMFELDKLAFRNPLELPISKQFTNSMAGQIQTI